MTFHDFRVSWILNSNTVNELVLGVSVTFACWNFSSIMKSTGCLYAWLKILHKPSSVIISLKLMKWRTRKDHALWGAWFLPSILFSLKQIVESCTEINCLWGYANHFWCFEVLVLKNRVKQQTLLTFCKNLKNRRKLDDFSGSNDFDCKNTHVKK